MPSHRGGTGSQGASLNTVEQSHIGLYLNPADSPQTNSDITVTVGVFSLSVEYSSESDPHNPNLANIQV